MAGEIQPLDQKFPIVDADGRPTLYFIQWAQQRQEDISGAALLDGGNAFTGDQSIDGDLTVTGIITGDFEIEWGNIVGSLSAQVDLQTALDAKIAFANFTNSGLDGGKLNFLEFGGPAPSVPGPGGLFSFGADDTGSGQPYFIWTNGDNDHATVLGNYTSHGRYGISSYGTTPKAWEFDRTPYVDVNQIYHEGNLTVFTSVDDGLVPASGGVGTVKFLREDGAWAAPPGGGGLADGSYGDVVVSGGGTYLQVNSAGPPPGFVGGWAFKVTGSFLTEAIGGYTSFQFTDNLGVDKQIWWVGGISDPYMYVDSDGIIFESLDESQQFLTLDATAGVFAIPAHVPNDAYGPSWNGNTEIPTKDALYDKIQTLGGGTTTNPVTFAATGGAAPGTTFDGSTARTIDYSTVGAAPAALTVAAVAGAAYAFVAADAGKHKRFTSAVAVAATVPPATFTAGQRIRITQAGAGTVTLVPGAGVTLNSRGGALAAAGQYSVFEIECVAANEFDVIGDVA